ncbi:MAG: ParB/RepB/Spo0J family partition protein [Candidatus Competibacteraceae bacterium]
MPRNLKALLEKKLAENSQRHAEAYQETEFDSGRHYTKLPVDSIDPNPYQARRIFPQQELEALAASIAEVGLLQPISVRQTGIRYQLIAGERRWRAHQLLGRPTIDALIMMIEDAEMATLALAENIDREDLSDYEISLALRNIETLFPTRKKLAEAIGINREDMYRYFAFESLPDTILSKLSANPRLLSRAAAADIKRVMQLIEPQSLADELLSQAWSLLEAGSLEQTKLAAYLALEFKARQQGQTAVHCEMQRLARDGRQIGSICRDSKHLTIKLKLELLSAAQEDKLRCFVNQLVTEKV